jgi:hypothetical protein
VAKSHAKDQSAPSSGVPVIVIGDVAIEWLAANWQVQQPKDAKQPWHRDRRQVQMLAMMSGAWLLDSFLLQLGLPAKNPHRYYCYERPAPLTERNVNPAYYSTMRRTADPEQILHAFTELFLFDRGKTPTDHCSQGSCPWSGNLLCGQQMPLSSKVYRFSTSPRYFGPKDKPQQLHYANDLRCRQCQHGKMGLVPPLPNPPEPDAQLDVYNKAKKSFEEQHKKNLANDLVKERVLVIYDGAQEVFRDQSELWGDLVPENPDEQLHIVVFQRPTYPGGCGENKLWDNRNTIVIALR